MLEFREENAAIRIMHDRPRVLLVTTRRWFSAARLAIALGRAGFQVEAVCPTHHPLRLVSIIHALYAFHSLRPLRSLRKATAASQPDLIIPCDDLAAIYLRRLHLSAVGSLAPGSGAFLRLVERSLGAPASHPFLASRAVLIAALVEKGIAAPETGAIRDLADLAAWCAVNGFPAVLKADGTWSGDGVRVVTNIQDAACALQHLLAPLGAVTVLKQMLLDRDCSLVMPWLRRSHRTVSIQAFIAGSECNIAVACWEGRVLASVSANVLHTWNKHGPSSIIRLIADGEMLRVARVTAETLNLSGLFGLDFIQNNESDGPLLLEINPRATQTCHLPLGAGHDLSCALFTALTGEQTLPVCSIFRAEIALFPLAWQGHPAHEAFASAYHDIPWEQPPLVRAGETEIRFATRTRWGKLWMKTYLSRSPVRIHGGPA